MTYQRYIKAVIYLVVSAWAVVLFVQGGTLQSSFLKPLSLVTSIVLWAVMAFDLVLWRLPILHGWFVKRPVIDGTWKVELQSNWIDPQTGKQIGPITAYMVVRQTLSTLSMRLLTVESSSALLGAEIVSTTDGLYRVSGVYENKPKLQYRFRSEIHYGALWLELVEDQGQKRIIGQYWTDRDTKGSLVLTDRQKSKVQSFEAAQALYTP